jgi:trans-L-3-hydroxyproline dehydratase
MAYLVKTIDAHAAGAPLRLIVDGMPRPIGPTMGHKARWLTQHADHLRRALVLEPRGHRDMCAAMLTEPVTPGAHAGIIFMRREGYTAVCGHGFIAVATIALERQLIVLNDSGGTRDLELVFDTLAAPVQVRASLVRRGSHFRVDTVSFVAPPSFVSSPGHVISLGARNLRLDIAFGGGFYAIVDTESIGVSLAESALPDLRRAARCIATALEGARVLVHPVHAVLSGLQGVLFTGPPRDPEAHLRNVTVYADGAIDRSPSGTGTAAVMAVLDAMGLIADDVPFVHESLVGTLFRGRIMRRTQIADTAAIVPEIEGSAWITGEHSFLIDDEDPFKDGMNIEN